MCDRRIAELGIFGKAKPARTAIDQRGIDVVVGKRRGRPIYEWHRICPHFRQIDFPATDGTRESGRISVDGAQNRIFADAGELEL